ncbi:PilN domain-containing protein [Pantoea sp. ACRSB]|uniref:PilN domain-containing protein n=1 Tax=Pantoea sp. ACRSB TaxID=2918207 RepID=UPI002892DBFA|nr:PilN domain-containing protein [Pantoea sp. ACRSB]MCG7390367.1 PilN domain-containing protein [Pantoea sp. ACRSB]
MIAVNLLPWRHARLRRQRRAALGVAATLLLALMLATALQLWHLDRTSQQLRSTQNDAHDALTTLAGQLSQRRDLQQQLATQQAQWRHAQRHADELMRWHQFWQALPALLPDQLWLERVEKEPARLSVEGRSLDMGAIGELRRRLGEQTLFAAVKQGDVARQPDGYYRFALRARLEESGDE